MQRFRRTFGLCGFPPQRDRRNESESSDGNHGLVPLDVALELLRAVLNRSVGRTAHGSVLARRRELRVREKEVSVS